MQENFFIIADGTYCHILPDKVVLNHPPDLGRIPEMDHRNRKMQSALFAALFLAIAAFFSFLFFTDRLMPELYIFILLVLAGALYRTFLFRDTSGTEVIERKNITSTKILRRFMGYTTWVIFFTNEKGEKLRRMVNLYDSKQMEEKAERIIRASGLL
ncbi:MAG TPA: hypothetical protein VI112_18460 [Bacteroidia bacterium]